MSAFNHGKIEGLLKRVEIIIRGGSPPQDLVESCCETLDEILSTVDTSSSNLIPMPMAASAVLASDSRPESVSTNETDAIINVAIRTHNKARAITSDKHAEIRSLLRGIAASLLYRYCTPSPKSVSQVVRLLSRVSFFTSNFYITLYSHKLTEFLSLFENQNTNSKKIELSVGSRSPRLSISKRRISHHTPPHPTITFSSLHEL